MGLAELVTRSKSVSNAVSSRQRIGTSVCRSPAERDAGPKASPSSRNLAVRVAQRIPGPAATRSADLTVRPRFLHVRSNSGPIRISGANGRSRRSRAEFCTSRLRRLQYVDDAEPQRGAADVIASHHFLFKSINELDLSPIGSSIGRLAGRTTQRDRFRKGL